VLRTHIEKVFFKKRKASSWMKIRKAIEEKKEGSKLSN
jgi:hypothetical protein